MTGTLYGIGVGPGDPELMTLKADRLIRAVPVIAYPAPDKGESFARSIAAGALSDSQIEIPMVVPMRVARFPAQDVYAEASDQIAGHLDAGHDVAVLCEGDPFFYGSFMYLFTRLAERFPVEVVPGVSSLGACSAQIPRPLTARNDVLTVIPGPLPDDEIAAHIARSEAVAIMKVGRHFPRLRALLQQLALTENARYVERASLAGAQALPLSMAPETAPYFSMILIYKGDDPWLS
ncbi:MAG: precorrin-2 C(20)-methyltransferase [Pseudomonadota bacterium]